MRALAAVLVGLVAWVSIVVPGQAAEPTRGETLHQACGGESLPACLAYAAGVVDLHDEALAPQTGPMFCAPDNVDFKAVAQGIWRWFEENPEFRGLPAVYGVTRALGLLYPCDESGSP